MCVPANAIPAFVTEALHLVAYVRLLLNDYESEVMAYTVLACSYWVGFYNALRFWGHAHY